MLKGWRKKYRQGMAFLLAMVMVTVNILTGAGTAYASDLPEEPSADDAVVSFKLDPDALRKAIEKTEISTISLMAPSEGGEDSNPGFDWESLGIQDDGGCEEYLSGAAVSELAGLRKTYSDNAGMRVFYDAESGQVILLFLNSGEDELEFRAEIGDYVSETVMVKGVAVIGEKQNAGSENGSEPSSDKESEDGLGAPESYDKATPSDATPSNAKSSGGSSGKGDPEHVKESASEELETDGSGEAEGNSQDDSFEETESAEPVTANAVEVRARARAISIPMSELFSLGGDVVEINNADGWYQFIEEAANNGGECKLKADISVNSGTKIGNEQKTCNNLYADVTVDLNGHTLTANGGSGANNVFAVHKDANLTIRDSAGSGKIVDNGNNNSMIWMGGGSLTIEGGTLQAKSGISVIANGWDASGTSNVTIKGGMLTGGKYGIDLHSNNGNMPMTIRIEGGTISCTENGIYDELGSTVIMTGGKITGVTGGSGIRIGGSTAKLNMTGGEISGCAGSGIVARDGADVTIDGGIVKENETDGGSVLIDGSSLTIKGTTIIDAGTVSTDAVKVEGNSSVTVNGGTITGYTHGINGTEGSTLTMTMTGGTITNKASGSGIHIEGSGSTLTISGGNVTMCKGSGIAVLHGATVNMSDGNVTYNTGSSGSGIYADDSAVVTVSGGSISNNTANNDGNGGGIFAKDSKVTISGTALIDSNTAISGEYTSGGGIYVEGASSELNLEGGTISNNEASGAGGIRICNGDNSKVSFTMTGGTVEGNRATKHEGGGIVVGPSAQGLISSGTIRNNKTLAANDWGGGGIFVVGAWGDYSEGILTIYNALITENHADGFGGGVGGCSTGHNNLTFEGGAAIYDNTADGTAHSNPDASSKHKDQELMDADKIGPGDGNDYFCALDSYVAGVMLGSGNPGWSGKADDTDVNIPYGGWQESNDYMVLDAAPSKADKEAARNEARVTISGNSSATHGGGIMNNGTLYLGSASAKKEGTFYAPVVKKTIEGIPSTDAVFTFTLTDENGNQIGTTSVQGAGTAKFGAINYEYDEVDKGKTDYTYTIKEVRGNEAGWSYDVSVWTLKVEVQKNGNGLRIKGVTYTKVGSTTSSNSDAAEFTNTYEAPKGSLEITKSVVGGGTEAADKTYMFTVTGPDSYSETVTITGNGNTTLEDLVPGEYTVTEDKDGAAVIGYVLTVNGEETVTVEAEDTADVTITNTYDQLLVSKTVTKIWADNDNQDGLRPMSIEVQLLADSEKYGEPVALNAENLWTYTWENLPQFKAGTEIVYTVVETAVENYSVSYSEDTFTITNSYAPGETSRTVLKVWNDAGNQDGLRPESISVQLLADGIAYGEAVILDAGNSWRYTWDKLPVMKNGERVVYTVEEVGTVENYESASAEDETTLTFTITNTHTPTTVEKTVTKIWNDENNRDGLRPESISVQLLADGAAYGEAVTLNTANNWKYTWEKLPALKDGRTVVYTVMELGEIAGYTTAYDQSALTITNTHTTVRTGGLSVSKTLSGNAAEQDRLFHFTVMLTPAEGNAAVNGTFGGMTFADNKAEFNLKGGETVTADGLPAGTGYSVAEDRYPEYDAAYTNENGAIIEGQIVSAIVNNHRSVETPPPTPERTPPPTPTTEIPDNPTPLSNFPDSPVPLSNIEDEDVPLAFMAPTTGDNKPVGAAALFSLVALGMMGAFGILALRKDEDET